MQLYIKTILTMVLLTAGLWVYGQKITGKVEGHSKGDMDIVLLTFGMDNPIKIGTLKADGDLEITLPGENPAEKLSEDDRDMYISELRYALQYRCAGVDDSPGGDARIATNAGSIALWANNTWAGALFPVSDSRLSAWMEDKGYNDAVEGSFYEILMLTEDVSLQKKCTTNDNYNDKDIEVSVEYDLTLKKGLNLVAYQIDAVYKTDPAIRASFPVKVKMTNGSDLSDVIWIAKYFY